MANDKTPILPPGSPPLGQVRALDSPESGAAIGRELLVVLAPLLVALVISDLMGSDRIDLPGDVAVAQGPLPFVGLVASLGLFVAIQRASRCHLG